ncbi:hypothetical protein [Mucilaginibacter gracilis]|uniref:hypothetical protein n=1 Tax=Mucilaginibacter gracilis TaxID=423350 RepID=UPI0011C36760|nr:hypothetical protein [Mucilaginibacter gracilis]
MKKVLALTLGFVVSSSLYILVTTLLFDNSLLKSIAPAFVCGIGSMAIIALFFNRRKMQLIPVRSKRY